MSGRGFDPIRTNGRPGRPTSNGVDISESERKINQLEAELNSPDFWKDKETAVRKVKELSELKEKAKESRELKDLKDKIDIIKELGQSQETPVAEQSSLRGTAEKELEKIEKKLKLFEKVIRFSGPHDKSDAILNIHSGAGGVDAQDWAMMLLKMYQRYAEKRGWDSKILDQSFGEQRGIKSAALEISGTYVYGYLKSESGVHRLVRISPFSAKGLRHTSFVLVEVLPEIEPPADRGGEMKIDPNDLKIETFRSSGPGGQHMQKTESAVRITHKPTGLTASVQSERAQSQNKQKAMKILESKLVQKMEESKVKEISQLKPELATGIEWGNQIRSYVLNPYKMVKDHRTGKETTQIENVLEGNLDLFID